MWCSVARQIALGRELDHQGTYISGGPFADTLKGEGGDDTLEGRAGADKLLGGPAPSDIASYLHAATGVTASLTAPAINTGDAAGDSYRSLKGFVGSRFADMLIGDDQSNSLTGDLGADTLTGGLGVIASCSIPCSTALPARRPVTRLRTSMLERPQPARTRSIFAP